MSELAAMDPGGLAVWDMGTATVLAAMSADGSTVDVTILDRGWDGEKRQESYRILRAATEGWTAEISAEGTRSAAQWPDLLPAFCLLMPPTTISGAGSDDTPPF